MFLKSISGQGGYSIIQGLQPGAPHQIEPIRMTAPPAILQDPARPTKGRLL